MSRRWRSALRPGPVVVGEDAEFCTPGAGEADAAALLEKSNIRNRELCQENELLHARVERLQNLYDAEIRRADDAVAELAEANARAEQQDHAFDALEAKLAAADDAHAGTCDHAALIRSQRVVMVRQQDRIDFLQAANMARDRAPRGWRRD